MAEIFFGDIKTQAQEKLSEEKEKAARKAAEAAEQKRKAEEATQRKEEEFGTAYDRHIAEFDKFHPELGAALQELRDQGYNVTISPVGRHATPGTRDLDEYRQRYTPKELHETVRKNTDKYLHKGSIRRDIGFNAKSRPENQIKTTPPTLYIGITAPQADEKSGIDAQAVIGVYTPSLDAADLENCSFAVSTTISHQSFSSYADKQFKKPDASDDTLQSATIEGPLPAFLAKKGIHRTYREDMDSYAKESKKIDAGINQYLASVTGETGLRNSLQSLKDWAINAEMRKHATSKTIGFLIENGADINAPPVTPSENTPQTGVAATLKTETPDIKPSRFADRVRRSLFKRNPH